MIFHREDVKFLATTSMIAMAACMSVWTMDLCEEARAVNLQTAIDSPMLEDPMLEELQEDAMICATLIKTGYLRDDVPLSYDLQAVLHAECEGNNVPYHIALGLIETESGFQTDAVSPAGCYGLFQLDPRYFPSGLSPEGNIKYGVGYLGDLFARYSDTGAALTAYNAGGDTGSRSYANRVLRAAERWK